MEVSGFMEAIIAGGAFIVGVIVATAGASWRLRGTIRSEVDTAMEMHLETEHLRDERGRSLRERVNRIEDLCKERHE